MGKITTHVLDTASGNPAGGLRVRLFLGGQLLTDTHTNMDGRCDAPLCGDAPAGEYELLFSVGAYYRGGGRESPFLDEVPVRFTVAAGRDHHVPLVCSPFSYSTYRGS